MYIVFIVTKNLDFLDSLPQAILNYDVRDLKFYFFSKSEQLDQHIMQSTVPDLILADREIRLSQVVSNKNIAVVYLSVVGDSEEEIFIYKNTESFLLDVQRRISICQLDLKTGKLNDPVSREKKVTWFLEINESEWGKSCFTDWTAMKFKMGQKALCIDLSRMGRWPSHCHYGRRISVSDVLQNWIYNREMNFESSDPSNLSKGSFMLLEGVKHPMDIEMIKPEFIEIIISQWGKDFDDICLYAPVYNEVLTKILLRFTENIWIISDQSDPYELPLKQMENWLMEVNPGGEVNLIHTRSDPTRQMMLKKVILDRCYMKGRI